MNEASFHFYLVLAGFGMAAAVFATLFFVSAPYGRHTRQGWGTVLPNHIGWVLMEAPSAVLFAFYFFTGSAPKSLPLVLFFCMWEAHYLHRAFIYPLTIRDGHKRMPLSVILMGVLFNAGNTYVNGRYLFTLSGEYPAGWITSPQFLIGAALFIAGLVTNRWADSVLRGLRKPGEAVYRIPYGSLFNLVSCPNYLGEIIEWAGWAIATWSLPGLAFAVWTFANLAPRARSHHAWYHKNFPGYPPQRRALFPGIW